jgi:choline dehydrogenase-like flavoprotein
MGAAGALAARLLAGAGLRVVGVEAGAWTVGDEHFKRSLPGVRRAADEPPAAPADPAPMVNGVGGSNHRSGRQSYRLDLEAMPRRWPLNTAGLVPYYERVEEAMRVRPSPPQAWTETMRAAAAELGWETVAAPVATAPPLGHAEVRRASRDDEPERIGARRVILAANTFENVRLLLLSRSAAHPDGVGNSTGRVGAGFATHNLLSVHGHFPGRDLDRAGGGTVRGSRARGRSGLGAAGAIAAGDQSPRPRPLSPRQMRPPWPATPRANAISTHAYGGTAMGSDPVASVVDSFGEPHDAPGLFVLGASTFPGTGGRGPTETIEALAWRTADRIAAELTD